MNRIIGLIALVAACAEPTVSDTLLVEPSVDLARCELTSRESVDEPWLPVDGMALSADILTLSVLGQWRGNYEDIHGDYQPASLHMVPSADPIYRVEYADEDGSCGVFVEVPMDVFLDVPCLIYGDVPTTITIGDDASGLIAFNKLDAPRNLLERPEFDASLLVGGSFEEGVLDADLLWESRDGRTAPGGSLSGALQ